jgi:hypothetical protein
MVAHPSQIQICPNPAKPRLRRAKGNQRKSLGFSWISFAELGLFNGLQRPPRPKNSLSAPSFPLAFRAPGALQSATGRRYHGFWFSQRKFAENKTRDRFFLIPAELGDREADRRSGGGRQGRYRASPPAAGPISCCVLSAEASQQPPSHRPLNSLQLRGVAQKRP